MEERQLTVPISNRRVRLTIVVTAKITATSFVTCFAKYIAREGYEVTIIADGIERLSQDVGKGTLSQVPISMARNPRPWRDLRSLVALTRQLGRIKPDVLTYATPKASLLGALAGFTLRVPIRVYQLWGLRLETTNGLRQLVLGLLERLTSLLSTKVLANSHSLADKYRELGLNSGKRIDILGQGSSHGVDVEHYARTSTYPPLDPATILHLNDKGTDLIVGFVGRLHPDKGIDTLIDATHLIRADGSSIKLIIVGSDEGADFDLSENFKGDMLKVGHVNDTRPYYAAMDVLVLPSLREGFPNAVLEAAAMSVPAIVSNGTGVVDSVIDGETGIIVPVGDSRALAQAILVLATNDELRERMGTAARLRVEEVFAQEQVWGRTLTYLTGEAGR